VPTFAAFLDDWRKFSIYISSFEVVF
jgi:hypothetical protein